MQILGVNQTVPDYPLGLVSETTVILGRVEHPSFGPITDDRYECP